MWSGLWQREPWRMGVVVTIVGLLGFGWGVSIGLIVGFFFFIYLQPMEVKVYCLPPFLFMQTKLFLIQI